MFAIVKKPRIAFLAAVAALAILAVGGCGGDEATSDEAPPAEATPGEVTPDDGTTAEAPSDEAPPPSDEALPRPQFVKQANALCKASVDRAVAGIARAYGELEADPSTTKADARQAEVNTLVPIVVAAAAAEASGLRELGAPDGDEERVAAITDALERWIQRARSQPARIVQDNDVYDDARSLAEEYGLEQCARSPFEG